MGITCSYCHRGKLSRKHKTAIINGIPRTGRQCSNCGMIVTPQGTRWVPRGK